MRFVVVGRAENPDSCGAASDGLGLGGFSHLWIIVQKNEHCFRLETWTAEICTPLIADVLVLVDVAVYRVKNVFIQRFPHHAQSFILHVTTHRPPRLSFVLAVILIMSARRFQRTHPLSGMGFSLDASKDIGMGVTDLAPICESEPVMDTVCIAVVAGSDREDRPSDVCYVGDTIVIL